VPSFLAVNASSKTDLLVFVPMRGAAEPKAVRGDLLGVLGEPGIEPPLLLIGDGRFKYGRAVGRPEAGPLVWWVTGA